MIDTTLDLLIPEENMSISSKSFAQQAPVIQPFSLQELLEQFEKDDVLNPETPACGQVLHTEESPFDLKKKRSYVRSKLSNIIVQNCRIPPKNEPEFNIYNTKEHVKPMERDTKEREREHGRSNCHIWKKHDEQDNIFAKLQQHLNQDLDQEKVLFSTRRPTKSHTTGTCTQSDTKKNFLPVVGDNKLGATNLAKFNPEMMKIAISQINLSQTARGEVFGLQVQGIEKSLTNRRKLVVNEQQKGLTARQNAGPHSWRGHTKGGSLFKSPGSEEKIMLNKVASIEKAYKEIKVEIKPKRTLKLKKKSQHQPLEIQFKTVKRTEKPQSLDVALTSLATNRY